jgi:hypothetical protein
MKHAVLLLAAVACAFAQKTVQHEGLSGLQLSSGKAELVVAPDGGAFVSYTLTDDPKRLNTMWDPARMSREKGLRPSFGASRGHFLCVDGFGPVTKPEAAAGLGGHGEANKQKWSVVESSDRAVTFKVKLPLVQEELTRKVSFTGDNVVLVESTLESLLPFDRVILWAEHATIGAPFLGLGKTVVDASSTQCQTKPYRGQRGPRTFASGANFEWPTYEGQNLRVSPAEHERMNHIGCLMDPKRDHEFITALNTDENLMLGYVFPRADYPWVQHWMNYPANGTYAWGLEFGMQPYDMTKQDILALTPMFGTPTFRWLQAKSKIDTKFLMFITKVPAGFKKTDDVRLEGGQLVIEDKGSSLRVTLPVSRGL